MKSNEVIDITWKLKVISELNRTCYILRSSYLESRRDELTEKFLKYLNAKKPINNPNADAIEFGFRESWLKKDYAAIVKAGELLGQNFFEDNRELEAFLAMARAKLQASNQQG